MDTSLTSETVMTLKVSELKAALTERGLETNGVKATLQKRLIEALGNASSGMEVEAAKGPEYVVDESTRYSGTVTRYFKRKGFGTICPEGKDATKKEDQIFVHWKQIQSSDEWPSLQQDQKVEYYLATRPADKGRKEGRKYAANVTLEGGLQVVFTDDRVFPDRSQRFAGTIEWMDPKKGFGFIKPKEDFNFDENDFYANKKGNIYIAREDIKTSDGFEKSPAIKGDTEVEFTLYKRKEGKNYAAADVTKPGGVPFEEGDLWLRKPFDPNNPRKRRKKGKKRKANQMQMSKKQMKALRKMMGGGMGGGMMMPMGGMGGMPMMMGGMGGMMRQPQMMMINGQPFMVMGGAQGGRKKKRRKNNKKKNKN